MTYRPNIRVGAPVQYTKFKGCYSITAVDADYEEPLNEVGEIDVCITSRGGAYGHVERLKVGSIHVAEPYRRHGIGTKLYESAARMACERGIPMASDNVPALSRYSKGFWEKQQQKGRAVKVGRGELEEFLLRQPCGADLSGMRGRRTKKRRRR